MTRTVTSRRGESGVTAVPATLIPHSTVGPVQIYLVSLWISLSAPRPQSRQAHLLTRWASPVTHFFRLFTSPVCLRTTSNLNDCKTKMISANGRSVRPGRRA